MLAALGTAAVSLTVRGVLPQPLWTSVHVVTLGVLTSSVLQWSWYFARALLHLQATDTRSGRDATLRMLAFHASLDGLWWSLVRYFTFPGAGEASFGFLVQSPTGEGLEARFDEIEWTAGPLDELRNGT